MVHSSRHSIARPTLRLTRLDTPQTQASAPRTILRAITALAGGEVLARLTAFGAVAILARRLGPDGFGVVGFATALCGYLALAVNSGLHDVGTREVARAPHRAADFYSSVTTIRLLLAAGAFFILAAVAGVLPKPPTTQVVVLLSGLSFFSFAVDPIWVLKGLERPVLAGFGLVLAQSVYAIGVLVAVHGPGDVTRVPVLQFTGELTAALLVSAVLLKGTRPRVALADGVQVLRSAGYLGLARFLRSIVITFDVVLLGFLATDRDVGLYTAAYRVTFLLMSIASAIGAAYLPSYARVMTGGGTESARQLVETSLGIALTIGAPLIAGAVVTARTLLTVLFGPPYVEAAPAFQLLALSVGLVFLHWSLSNVLIVARRTRLQATIHGAAAAVNVGLNVLLIPPYGIVGSAAATVIAELTVVLAGVDVLRRMKMLPAARPLLRPLVAAGGMSIVVWLIAPYVPLVVQIAAGGVIYAGALVAVGGVSARDVRNVLMRP